MRNDTCPPHTRALLDRMARELQPEHSAYACRYTLWRLRHDNARSPGAERTNYTQTYPDKEAYAVDDWRAGVLRRAVKAALALDYAEAGLFACPVAEVQA